MGDLIPTINFSNLKKLSAKELRAMKSVEVLSDGEYLFTIIIPPTGDFIVQAHIRTEAEYLGNKSNIPGGKTPEEILNKESVTA